MMRWTGGAPWQYWKGVGWGPRSYKPLTQYLGGAMDLWLDALLSEWTLGVTPNW